MKTRILTIAIAALFSINSFSQEKAGKCKCFDKEEYEAFIAEEQHQTVVEGNDAQLTVILSRVQKEDIIITYKVIPGTAKINDDIIIPEINTFTIPAGQTRATVHIPTVKDRFSELEESFTIEIIEGINSKTNKKLNNNKLIRTRTIVDNNSDNNTVNIYTENGTIKTNPAPKHLEVRNINGLLVPNKNLIGGTYFINAVVNNQSISKTIIITK